jgi:hypothetical protein
VFGVVLVGRNASNGEGFDDDLALARPQRPVTYCRMCRPYRPRRPLPSIVRPPTMRPTLPRLIHKLKGALLVETEVEAVGAGVEVAVVEAGAADLPSAAMHPHKDPGRVESP